MAAPTTPRVTRATLTDRYEGLLERGLDPSKLRRRLDRVLEDLLVGTARIEFTGELGDGNQTGAVFDAADLAIRETLKRGIAR